MQSGYSSFTSFAQEVDARNAEKRDYAANSSLLRMVDDDKIMSPLFEEQVVSPYAHGQIAERMKATLIPGSKNLRFKEFYDGLTHIPDLRKEVVNRWLEHEHKDFFVRTLRGNMRAFLSNKYRPFDHVIILSALLPLVEEHHGEVSVASYNITDSHLYLQLVFDKIQAEVQKGDIVKAGITVVNSEIGLAAADVKEMAWFLRCLNGMVGESVLRSYHVGARIDYENSEIFQDDTIRAEIESFRLRLRDVMKDAVSQVKLNLQIDKMQAAAKDKVYKPQALIKEVTKFYNFNEAEGDLILTDMIDRGDISRYGLMNGITALAHRIENPNRQYEVERIGHQVLEMKRSDWAVLNVA